MLLPCCVAWGKSHNLSGSASPARKPCAHRLHMCSRVLAPTPPKPPHRGAARPSCLLEAPLEAGRRQPWPPLLPASFLSHFSASGQALRALEAKTEGRSPGEGASEATTPAEHSLSETLRSLAGQNVPALWDKPLPGASLET